jgi:hypothetical protein
VMKSMGCSRRRVIWQFVMEYVHTYHHRVSARNDMAFQCGLRRRLHQCGNHVHRTLLILTIIQPCCSSSIQSSPTSSCSS